MDADTDTIKYIKLVYRAVSAGFINREDVMNKDPSAKIRVRVGLALFNQETNKELIKLNLFYQGIFMAIFGIGNYKEDEVKRHEAEFHQTYQRLWHSLIDKPFNESEISPEIDALKDLYNYLFKK